MPPFGVNCLLQLAGLGKKRGRCEAKLLQLLSKTTSVPQQQHFIAPFRNYSQLKEKMIKIKIRVTSSLK